VLAPLAQPLVLILRISDERVYDPDALEVAAVLEILGVDQRNAVFFGRRPDERVPKRETVARNCIDGPKRHPAGQRQDRDSVRQVSNRPIGVVV
jgi:hypothetical protein